MMQLKFYYLKHEII